MKREILKFLSGLFAGFAIEHAVLAVYMAQGMLNQPHMFGRQWGPGYGWIGAVLYAILSLGLGYLGWRSVERSAEADTRASAKG